MSVKMIFSDIDGTLINSKHVITEKTIKAIKSCARHQLPFILVSARMPGGILPLQQQLGLSNPIVCYSGALIVRPQQTGSASQPLLTITMDTETVLTIHQHICKRFPNISFSAYSFDQWLVQEPNNPWIEQERQIAGTAATLCTFQDDDMDVEFAPIHKVLCMGEPEKIDQLYESLLSLKLEVSVFKSKPTYLEIMAKDVGKAGAMNLLMKEYNVRREETIAFGDNFNDLDMLRFAGIGVAMDNAPSQVKGAADFVTLSNDQDGIQAALERFGIVGSIH
ncbi:Cof-type HAD-IIB family hydrolase [Sporolactobacillus laevolacticus]|uniref:Cof-type HAD-IIB family hydrolase n=1 Tax=Sporolactobacillus laevolacticus TaxID=33018 RepID=UPI000403C3C1|nr:Cof-type HAD-IIB family hydrolase [Sporolactobacillus laevolacticus]